MRRVFAVLFAACMVTAFAACRSLAASDPPPPFPIRPMPVERIIESATLIYEVAMITRSLDGLEAKLRPLSPAMRKLALLSLVWHGWGRDGLHTFFFVGSAAAAPEIMEALKQPGFDKQRRAFAQAIALFGPIYPRAEYLRATFFRTKPSPSPFDSDFDKKLYALGKAFGSKEEYGKALARMVARNRELSAFITKARETVADETRMFWLTEQIGKGLSSANGLDEVRRRLASWPAAYRIIYLLDVFNLEMLNGGVDQYFYNSSGELAPETVMALREAGLGKHAKALQDCVDMFGAPYPADTQARREGYFHDSTGLLARLRRAALERATGLVDDGQIHVKIIEIARRARIWPQ